MTSLVERFIEHLRVTGYECGPEASQAMGLAVRYLDLSGLRLRFSDRSPVIEIPRSEIESRSVAELMSTLKDLLMQLQLEDRIPIVLCDGPADELRKLCNRPPYYVVVLGESEMQQVIASRATSDQLLALMRPQVPLSFLSPYEVSAPVTGGQFFGREYEVRTILGHPDTCYTVIGTRRIGKTSVLREVQRRMRNAEPDSQRFVYCDCMAFDSREDFFERIITDLQPKEITRMWRAGANYPARFVLFMRRLRKVHGRPIVLFLDEVDHLLKFDRQQDYALVHALRACVMEKTCRIISAGFRGAQHELAGLNTPFNFSTALPLGNLTMKQGIELVTAPMANLGVRYVSQDQVIRRIVQETAGHPNLIQHYCLALIRQLDEEDSREITPEHLSQLVNDEGFRIRVLETFVFNTNDLEKAIAYSVADRELFTTEDIDRRFKQQRILLQTAEIEDACRTLELLGVLEPDGPSYRFTMPVLPMLLRERYSAAFLFSKAEELRKLRKRGGESL